MSQNVNGAVIYSDTIEASARAQIERMMDSPAFKGCPVRIMPDVHAGKGSVIGFTCPVSEYVIPNVIGVDIGCGVLAAALVKTPTPEELDALIRKRIPSGFSCHQTPVKLTDSQMILWRHVKQAAEQLGLDIARVRRSIGTLGGGNHFIEIDVDVDTGSPWVLIHSGSRNFGLQTAAFWQGVATHLHPEAGDLAWLEGARAGAYFAAMQLAQNYAALNREKMLDLLDLDPQLVIDTVHNYIGEDGIIRKGAVSARAGERVVIPWNMRDGAIIGEGLGNQDWNCSAPHGAGRTMGRGEAKRTLSLDEYNQTMEGVWSSCVGAGTLDEAPMAYKNAREIEAALAPTVRVLCHLKPVYNFKAGGE